MGSSEKQTCVTSVRHILTDFRALIVKSFLLAKRKRGQTIAEILLAYVFLALFLGMRYILDRQYFPAYQMPTFRPTDTMLLNGTFANTTYYYPNNTCTSAIVTSAMTRLTTIWPIFSNNVQVIPDPTLASLSNTTLQSIFAFIYFNNLDSCTNTSTMPDQVAYTIRMQENGPFYYRAQRTKIDPVNYYWKFSPEFYCQDNSSTANYTTQFLGVQYLIDLSIIQYVTGTAQDISSVNMNHFGCPTLYQDSLSSSFNFFVPIFFSIVYIVTFILNVGYVVEERENKTKEYLRIFGLRTWVNNLVWVIRPMCIFFVLTGISTGLSLVVLPSTGATSHSVSKAIFNFTDWTLIWTVLFVYSIQVSAFSVLFGQFFHRPLLAKVLGFVVWVLTFIDFYSTVPVGARYFLCLFPNMGLMFCLQVLLQYERKSSGFSSYNNLYSNLFPYPLYIGICLLMMLIYSVIYMLLAIYVERINPGAFGVAQPWNYLFKKSYWRLRSASSVRPISASGSDRRQSAVEGTHNANHWIELGAVVGGKPPSITVNGLNKKFGKLKAVKNLTLNFYSGEVCSLLGHNGAGKTTTTFILVGMLQPTSGSVIIEGLDSRLHIQEVRKILGFCPQYDILYDELSVQEHLELLAQMRHLDAKKSKESVEHILELISLENDRSTLSKNLSGGMKRRLSIGMSMIGDPKILILDEPTSGIDPYNRRLIWTIIRRMKDAGKCVVLTTHFLEEADVLSDRIAIMTSGRLQASGTPDFLKHQTDFEYRIFIDKQQAGESTNIMRFVQDRIPEVVLEREVACEMVFGIKRGASKEVGQLIDALDRQSNHLGINGYGLSMTSIEDVFLKLVREEEDEFEHRHGRGRHVLADKVFRTVHKRLVDTRLFWHRIWALLVKRWILLRREYVFLFGVFLVPIVLEIIIVAAFPTPQQIQSSLSLNDRVSGASVTLLPSIYNPQTIVTYTDPANPSAGTQLLNYLNNQGATIDQISTDTVSDYVRARYYQSEDIFVNKYQVGFGVYNNGSTSTIRFNSYFSTVNYHTMPVSLSVATNNLFQFASSSASKSIVTINQPIITPPINESYLSAFFDVLYCFDVLPTSLFDFFHSVLVSLFASVLMITYIRERVSHSKDLQLLTKLTKFGYWLSHAIFDLILCLILSIIFISIIKIAAAATTNSQAEVYIYQPVTQGGYFFLMILMYCAASLPFVYAYSFIPNTELLGFIGFFLLNVIINFVDVILMFIATFSQTQTRSTGQMTKLSTGVMNFRYIIGFIFPSVNFKRALTNIRIKSSPTCIDALNSINGESMSANDPWLAAQDPGLGVSFLFFILQGFIWLGILILVENKVAVKRFFRRICCCCCKSSLTERDNSQRTSDGTPSAAIYWDDSHLDEDVRRERQSILQETPTRNSATILSRDLVQKFKKRQSKSLKSRIYTAVDHLNFRVVKQSCFGLLGANGAGKTTTFRMLINDLEPTTGDIFINGRQITRKKNNVEIGFCPQFDWLVENLNVQETLTLFARLKGLHGPEVEEVCRDMIDLFALDTYEKQEVQKLSGGNKRKVSAAVSFVANPELVFLDEPTTGLDAAAKRKLWDVIRAARDIGLTIVMTSHSMEECEALCTKIGIMKSGQFMCLGNLQHLKNRFGTGYAVRVKVTGDHFNRVKDELRAEFPGIEIEEHHNGVLFCNIPFATSNTNDRIPFSLARVFDLLSNQKQLGLIESYSVSQTTLEQIFVRLAGEDEEKEETESSQKGIKTTSSNDIVLQSRFALSPSPSADVISTSV